MTSNIKPGIVRHVERGVGLARRTETYPDGIVITFLGPQNLASSTTLLDGWENVDVVKPGHVQVRVDDLQREDFNHGRDISSGSLADIRLWNACQGDSQPDEAAPRPTEMTVTLGCPECGGEVEAHVWLRELQGGCYAVSTPATHACPPAQPDEPTDVVGSRVRRGKRRLVGTDAEDGYPWVDVETGERFAWPCADGPDDGDAITLGWGDES